MIPSSTVYFPLVAGKMGTRFYGNDCWEITINISDLLRKYRINHTHTTKQLICHNSKCKCHKKKLKDKEILMNNAHL
jgi:hypothetical protein